MMWKRILAERIKMVITQFVIDWFAGINYMINRKYLFYRDALT